MSRYELVARGEIPEEDDSNYSVRIAQDRLKRKKHKRILMAFIFILIFFFIAAGIAAGVVMGVSTANSNGDGTETNKNLVLSTAAVNSPPPSVTRLTSLKVATSSATRGKTLTALTATHHSSSHKTLSPTSVPSVPPQATTTKKVEVPGNTPPPTGKITFTDHATTPSHTNSPTSTIAMASIGVSSAAPQATMTTKTVINSEASSHTPSSTKTITVTDHKSEGTGTPSTATIKASSTNYVVTKSAATVATLTTPTTSPKHTSASESTTGRYSVIITSTASQIHITSSQHTSLIVHTTTSVSPSPTVIPVNTVNSQIFNYIDTSYDPCENFYEYSCGQWHDNYPIVSEWGTFHDLALDNYNRIGEYLSQYVSYRDPDAIKKAKYIYSACKDSVYISKNLVSQLSSFMVYKAGGWENGDFHPYDSWSIDNDLYKDHYLGSSAFFTFGVEPDDLDSSKQVIRIRQAGLTYSSPEKYQGVGLSELITMIENILKAFNPYGDYYITAYNIAHLERSLSDSWVTRAELRNSSALYNPMTLDELSQIFSLNWVNYFNNYFKKAGYTRSFNGSTVVIVETPSYFRAINSYLTSSAVVDYVKWQLLVNEVALYTASLSEDTWRILQEIKFPKTSKLSQDINLNCVELVESAMPLAVARPFVEAFITDTTRVNVAEVASQIKIAFKQRVMEKTWLDETSKNRTMEKVDAITEQIAYPDFIKIDEELNNFYADLDVDHYTTYFNALGAIREFVLKKMISHYFHPTDKTEWINPPTEVNAYYTPQFNQFVILAGILRPPFYAVNWSPFLIYGALGTVIGHELTHGFDDQGQQYNKDGNRVKWWTSHSIRHFNRRTQCFVDQYDQYLLQGNRIDGQLTLGENIADNGGIHTAFRAYKNVMHGVSEQHVKGHSGDQLFFVAYAQLWCSKFTSEALEVSTKTDPHSPGPIRVLGSLVNSEEFATAFQCSVGSTMYPSNNRCELW